MILDQQLSLSAAQAVTAIGDTASTNAYDRGQAADTTASGLTLVVSTAAAVTSGGSPTVQAILQHSADGSSFTDVQAITPPLAPAALTAAKVLARHRLPAGLRRYVRVAYRVAGATLTAGSFTSMLVMDANAQQYLPSGFAVRTA